MTAFATFSHVSMQVLYVPDVVPSYLLFRQAEPRNLFGFPIAILLIFHVHHLTFKLHFFLVCGQSGCLQLPKPLDTVVFTGTNETDELF